MSSDCHDSPHETRHVEALGDGWAVLSQQCACGRHARFLLARGEGGPEELLGCWHGDEPLEPGTPFGIPSDEVPEILHHCVAHLSGALAFPCPEENR